MSDTLKKVEGLRHLAATKLMKVADYPPSGPQGEVLTSIAASLLGLLELSIWQVSRQYGVLKEKVNE